MDEETTVLPEQMTVREFVETYQKYDRLHGRGDDYAESVIASSEEQFSKYGYTLISRHESAIGEVVWYGTPEWRRKS